MTPDPLGGPIADVDRLRSAGYPVASTSGPAGGYSLGAGRSCSSAPRGPAWGLLTVSLLAEACSENVEVTFRSADRAGARSVRRVEPRRLVQAGRHWYLVAWDTRRRDFRTFRVDRMAEAACTGKTFTPRPSPDDARSAGGEAPVLSRRTIANALETSRSAAAS